MWYNHIMYYEGKYRKKREKKQQKAKNRRLFLKAMLPVVIPVVLCVGLGIKVVKLEKELLEVNASLAKLQYTMQEYEASVGTEVSQGDVLPYEEQAFTQVPAEEEPLAQEPGEERSEASEMEAETPSYRRVYLTFDDGPSIYTTEILDILDEYKVKATFFVLGKEDEVSTELIREIEARGHTVGMHSYSHKYSEIYASKEAFIEDYRKIRNFLSESVGIESFCYRFPGGSSNTISSIDMLEFADYLEEQGVIYHDWNISSGDGSSTVLTAEQIKENVLKDMAGYKNAVVLLHDSGDKRTTVDALPGIIEAILAMEDTRILPISEDTVPVQHIQRVKEQ